MSNEIKPESPDPKLEARLALLEELFVRFAETGTVQNTLGQGFETVSGHLSTMSRRLENIAAELMPLRALSGAPVPLSEEQKACLDHLIAAQARPSFRNVKALTVTDVSVRFIGDPPEAAKPSKPRLDNRSLAS